MISVCKKDKFRKFSINSFVFFIKFSILKKKNSKRNCLEENDVKTFLANIFCHRFS